MSKENIMARKMEALFFHLVSISKNAKILFDLREKYRVPVEGYFSRNNEQKGYTPQQWEYKSNKGVNRTLSNELFKIIENLDVDATTLFGIQLRRFFFYGDTDKNLFYKTVNTETLAVVEDSGELFQKSLKDKSLSALSKKEAINILEREQKRRQRYPIAIRISTYASEDMIINYVKEYKNYTKKFQDKYLSRINFTEKINSKPNANRNAEVMLLYHGMTAEKVANILNKKYPSKLSEAQVRQIVSKQKKRDTLLQ